MAAAVRRPRQNTPKHAVPRGAGGRWLKGVCPNPGGRPGGVEDVRLLARQHTPTAIDALVKIATSGKNESARVAASTALLDRGWGRPTQPLAGDSDMPPLGISLEDRRREVQAILERAFGDVGREGAADG